MKLNDWSLLAAGEFSTDPHIRLVLSCCLLIFLTYCNLSCSALLTGLLIAVLHKHCYNCLHTNSRRLCLCCGWLWLVPLLSLNGLYTVESHLSGLHISGNIVGYPDSNQKNVNLKKVFTCEYCIAGLFHWQNIVDLLLFMKRSFVNNIPALFTGLLLVQLLT